MILLKKLLHDEIFQRRLSEEYEAEFISLIALKICLVTNCRSCRQGNNFLWCTRGPLFNICLFTGCECIYSFMYRSKLRQQYMLTEQPCNDCLVHCCCECCALCQEYRELKYRGLESSLGWQGNLATQSQGVVMPPVGPGEMKPTSTITTTTTTYGHEQKEQYVIGVLTQPMVPSGQWSTDLCDCSDDFSNSKFLLSIRPLTHKTQNRFENFTSDHVFAAPQTATVQSPTPTPNLTSSTHHSEPTHLLSPTSQSPPPPQPPSSISDLHSHPPQHHLSNVASIAKTVSEEDGCGGVCRVVREVGVY
ncbi:PLAC8 motif-containing protein [Artemisia annua]|uniref:PLAC8 motif-containing protein n=1 Tax=Artemisia annua TaxID=35608 RepID=A0A2U1Q716_ARTAN|nr:PLAC8 motif-containing protein [Artemisia annua]